MAKRFIFYTYWRDRSLSTRKFSVLDEVLKEVTERKLVGPLPLGDIDGISVESPEILGDTYDEIVANLNKIALAGLVVSIQRPRPVID